MNFYKKLFFTTALFILCPLCPVSIVYNMRIAEITKRQQITPNAKRHNILGETTVGQWRTLKNGFKQSVYGGITTYIRSAKSLYLKVDGAFGRVKNNIITNIFKRTQTDDLLFTGGYSHALSERVRITYSGLLGIPTHRDFILDLAQLGTGHVGLGGQIDTSFAYTADRSNVALGAIRLVHFFPRNVTSHNPCLQQLYQCKEYNLSLGNILDVYVAHQTNWGNNNRFELGYDASILGFGSRIKPEITNFSGSLLYIRNNFFSSYSRRFSLNKTPVGIVTGLSGGFDSRPKTVGNRHMLTAWFLIGMLF